MLLIINEEIKKSMKNKDSIRLNVLRMIKSKLESAHKEKSKHSDLDVIISYYKSLEKSLNYNNLPEDFILSTKKELEIINEFIPQSLTDMEIIELINKSNSKNIGEIISFIKQEANKLNKICDNKKIVGLIKSNKE